MSLRFRVLYVVSLNLKPACLGSYGRFLRLALLLFILVRADSPSQAAPATNPTSITGTNLDPLPTSRLGVAKMVGDLIGRQVRNARGKSEGTISDIYLDLSQNRAAFVELGRHRIFPCSAFALIRDDVIQLRTNATACTEPIDLPKQNLTRARPLRGQPLIASSGDNVAEVKDVLVDILAGRAVYVVTETNERKKRLRSTRLLPPAAVRQDAAGEKALLLQTGAHFLAGPVLDQQFPVEMFTSPVATAVYHHYGLGVTDIRPASSGEENLNLADVALTRAVLAALPDDDASRQVMVMTREGLVILRGEAQSRKHQKELIAAAEKVAGPGQVRNEMTIGSGQSATR
jgi:sporulation protein YlmC with PRC-barrel domain